MLNKKILLLLCLVFCISAVAVPAFAAEATYTDTWPYVPWQQFLCTFHLGDDPEYNFLLPVPTANNEGDSIEMYDDMGRYVGLCTPSYDAELQSICYAFLLSVDVMAVKLQSYTPRIVAEPSALCYVRCPSQALNGGLASVGLAYPTGDRDDDSYIIDWVTDSENRTYGESAADSIARVPINPVSALLVTSVFAEFNYEDVFEYIEIIVPVQAPGLIVGDTYPAILREWGEDIPLAIYVESTGMPNTFTWVGDMLQGILEVHLFPGITIGGLVFAFLGICAVIMFLKLYAGG